MKKATTSYQDTINLFSQKKVLVIGDFILDVYLKGNSTRLCPEAPVPVVDIECRDVFPGGAANTACNISSLGADVTYCTVVGDDAEGEEAIALLQSMNLRTDGVFREPGRNTLVKTRIISGGHAITRYDKGHVSDVSKQIAELLNNYITATIHQFDAIYFSDYNKGVITASLMHHIDRVRKDSGIPLVVDSKRLADFAFLKPDLVKPNYDEILKLTGATHQGSTRIAQVRSLLPRLQQIVDARIMAVTLDQEGSLIMEDGRFAHRCFAHQVPDAQVSGAGDSYLSAFMLSWLVSGELSTAGEIATAAASIAIRKESTATCTAAELMGYFNLGSKLVESREQLEALCRTLHQQSRRIIFTNGCFDILHSGHVTYLHCVRRKGDVLIVGLNNDESISRLKGPGRPINPLEDRLQVIAGLGSVDYVVPFGEEGDDTPIELIKIIRPQIFAKGGDYTKDRLPEASIVEQLGGEIVFVPYLAERSTTNIIRQIGMNKKEEALRAAAGL